MDYREADAPECVDVLQILLQRVRRSDVQLEHVFPGTTYYKK